MAIKISGSTIIDDSRVIVNADKIGIGQTTPRYDLEIFSTGTPTGIAVSSTSSQETDTNKAISIFNNSSTLAFSASYRGRVDAQEYHGVFKGTIDTGVSISKADTIDITDDTTGSGTHYIHFGSATDGYDGVEVDSTGLVYKDGKFGIGTNNPTQELTLYGDDPIISVQEASASSQVDIGTGTVTGFINIQKADGTRTVQITGNGKSYFTGGGLGIGTVDQTNYGGAVKLALYSTGHTGFTIAAGTSSDSNIFFADGITGDATYRGNIKYTHNGDSMRFHTAAEEQLRITSDGFVGIGTDNPATKLDVQDGDITIRNGLEHNAIRTSSDGKLQFLRNAASNNTVTVTIDDADGSVGIGSTIPGAGLDIRLDTNPVLSIDRGSANNTNFNLKYNGNHYGQISAANQVFQISAVGASTPMDFYVNGSDRLRINTDGDLLRGGTGQDIGASDAKWDNIYANKVYADIEGSITPSGSLTISDNLTVNGNTTLGDASGDSLTVNATSSFNAASTFISDDGIFIKSSSNAPTNGAQIKFSDYPDGTPAYNQVGHIKYLHSNGAVSPNSKDGFLIGGSESLSVVKVEGRVLVDEKIGIGTDDPRNDLVKINHAGTDTPITALTISGQKITTGGGSGIFLKASPDVLNDDRYGARIHTIREGTNNGATSLAISNENSDSSGLEERLRITSAGLVGIGTTNPSQMLTVRGTILKTRSDSGIGLIYLANDGSNNGYIDINQNAGVTRVKLNSAGDSYFTGGDVGIGTAAASERLHVYHATENLVAKFESGDTGAGIIFKDNTHSTTLQSNNGAFEINVDNGGDLSSGESLSFKISDSERLRITGIGSVGIGTDDPDRFVHILDKGGGNRIMNIEGTANSGAFLAFLDVNTTDDSKVRIGTKGGNKLSLRGDEHHFESGVGASKMVITSGGKVGINSTDPSQAQFLSYTTSGSSLAALKENTGASLVFGGVSQPRVLLEASATASDFIVYVDNGGSWDTPDWSEKLRINSDGDLLRGGTNQDIGASGAKWDNIYANKVYADIEGSITPSGSVTITNDLTVNGNTTLGSDSNDTLTVNADAIFNDELEVYGTDASALVHFNGHSRGGIAAFNNLQVAFVSTNVNDDLLFGYSNNPPSGANFVPRMKIDNGTGFVGIGNTSPDTNLHVKGTGTDILKIESTDAGAQGANLILHHSPGAGNMADNDVISLIQFNGVDDSNNNTTYSSIRAVATDVSNNSEKGDLTFFTRNGSDFLEKLRITSDGNVGIGTDDPSALVHIEATEPLLRLENTHSGSKRLDLRVESSDNNAYVTAPQSGQYLKLYGRGGFTIATNSETTERLRITSDGYVGINETSPIHPLSIGINTATAWDSTKNISNTTNNDFIGLNIDNSNSGSNPEVGIMFQAGSSSSGQYTINCRKSGGNTADLILRTRDGGSASKETLRITSDGNVGIGTTNPNNPLTVHGSGNHIFLKDTATDNIFQIRHATGVAEFNTYGTGGARRDFVFNQYATEVLRINTDGDLLPGGSSQDIGSSSDRWNDIFAVNANFSGTVTYESVTDIDAVGVITARDHIKFANSGDGIIFGTEGSSDRPSIIGTYAAADDNYMSFNTTGDERFRITKDGKFSLGTINATPSAGVHIDIDSNNMLMLDNATAATQKMFFAQNGGTHAQIYGTSNTGAFTIESDPSANHNGSYIDFRVDNEEAIRIEAGGNVGIGTHNPECILDISKSISGGVNNVDIRNHDSTGGAALRVKTQGTYAAPTYQAILGASDAGGTIRVGAVSDHDLLLLTNNDAKVTIKSGGKVGIGTNSAYAKLEIGTGTETNSDIEYYGQDFAIAVRANKGENAGDEGNGIVFLQKWWNSSTDLVRTGAILGYKDSGNGNFGGGLIFKTQEHGASPMSEKLRINRHGNIGIGSTGTDQRLNVSGNIELNSYEDSNGQNGYYYQKGLIIGNAYDAGKGSISGVSDDRNAIIWQERGLNLDFATNNIHRMTLTYDGNLGIGTNNPTGAQALTGNNTTLAVGNLIAGNITGPVTGEASKVTIANGSDNRVITAASSNTLNAEENFTYNGTSCTIKGTTDGVLNLDTTDSRGTFIRFQQGGTTKVWVGSGQGLSLGDKDDLGLRATDNIIMRAGSAERLRIASDGDITHTGDGNVEYKMKCGTETGNNIIAFLNSSGTTKGNITYDSDNNFLFFNVNQDERLRIMSDGKIGINTTSVYDTNTMLQVNGKTNAGPNLVLHRNDTSVSTNQVLGALRVTGNDSNGTQQESSAIEFQADLDHATDDKPGRIVFKTTNDGASSATEKLRITSGGKVCIAHNGALHSGNLQVSTSSEDAIDINAYSSTADEGGRLSFYRSKNASIGSNTIVANGDSLGRIDFRGYNSNGNSYNQGATIEAVVDGSVNSSTDMPSAILFKTSADGSANPDERLRITKDGNVGIGTNNPTGANALTGNNTTLAVGTLKATTITGDVAANELILTNQNNDSSCFPVFVQAITENTALLPHTNSSFTFNASTGGIGATTFTSTASQGTAPFTVSSTTRVDNLNADLLDNRDTSDSGGNDKVMITNSSGNTSLGSGTFTTGVLKVTGNANPVAEFDRGSANNTNLNLKYNGEFTGQVSVANSEFQLSAVGSATTFKVFTNGLPRFEIDVNGNIGVNATPKRSGTLYDTVDHFLVIGDNDTGIAQDGDGQFEIWANNQEIANFNASNITLKKATTIDGNLTVDGTITYEDVTNVNTTGIITAAALEITGNTTLGSDSSDTLTVNANATFNDELEVFKTDASALVHYNGHSRGGIAAFTTQQIALVTTAIQDDLLFGYSNNPPSSANFVPRMKIDNGTGYVSIGHTSPATRLDVKQNNGVAYDGNVQTTAYNAARFFNESGHTNGGTYTGLQFNITGNSQNRICSIGMISEASNSKASSLVFHTDDNGNRTEKLRIASNGDVKVTSRGNSASGAPFYVAVDGKSSITYAGGNDDTACLRIVDNQDDENNYYHGLELRTKNNGDVRLYAQDKGSNLADFVLATDGGNDDGIKERLRVASDGNVGIGTDNPLYPLHITNAMGSSPSFIHMAVTGSNTVGGGGGIAFDTSASSSDSNNSLYLATIAGIRNSANNGSNDLVFSTTKGGENSNLPKERLRITMNGGIAFNGATNYGTSGQILKSNGDAPPTWIDNAGATVDVKQYKVGSTERSCTNPITVNSGTIGITSASNAYGGRYISTEGTSGTYCDGDIWYDISDSAEGTGELSSDVIEANNFFQNPTSMTQTTSFPASGTKNGGVFGPYTIANGVTFTINSGSTFTII